MKIPVTITRKQHSTTVSLAKNTQGLVKSETIIVELQGALESSAKDLETDDPQAALEGAEIGLIDLANPASAPIYLINRIKMDIMVS
ncbi:hypothetical protein PGT21_022348 [Puccinia graminis f. sp. tritici]|nr:hypothetical protein PGT21_022348 [Puccinia graminis f. sp. tritici]KAA1092370.1 hypothetical protein PGTUg99_023681 [Puccinia graminis f. sp. tritici]